MPLCWQRQRFGCRICWRSNRWSRMSSSRRSTQIASSDRHIGDLHNSNERAQILVAPLPWMLMRLLAKVVVSTSSYFLQPAANKFVKMMILPRDEITCNYGWIYLCKQITPNSVRIYKILAYARNSTWYQVTVELIVLISMSLKSGVGYGAIITRSGVRCMVHNTKRAKMSRRNIKKLWQVEAKSSICTPASLVWHFLWDHICHAWSCSTGEAVLWTFYLTMVWYHITHIISHVSCRKVHGIQHTSGIAP